MFLKFLSFLLSKFKITQIQITIQQALNNIRKFDPTISTIPFEPLLS